MPTLPTSLYDDEIFAYSSPILSDSGIIAKNYFCRNGRCSFGLFRSGLVSSSIHLLFQIPWQPQALCAGRCCSPSKPSERSIPSPCADDGRPPTPTLQKRASILMCPSLLSPQVSPPRLRQIVPLHALLALRLFFLSFSFFFLLEVTSLCAGPLLFIVQTPVFTAATPVAACFPFFLSTVQALPSSSSRRVLSLNS